MNPSLPIRCGDLVRTLPASGDADLTGRVNAVFPQPSKNPAIQPSVYYYRVRFPLTSPYFNDDAGVVYREGEIALLDVAPTIATTTKLPNRPKPFQSK